jgi:hypothetical protein
MVDLKNKRPSISELAQNYTCAMRVVEALELAHRAKANITVQLVGSDRPWSLHEIEKLLAEALAPYLPQAMAVVEKRVRYTLEQTQKTLEYAQKVI